MRVPRAESLTIDAITFAILVRGRQMKDATALRPNQISLGSDPPARTWSFEVATGHLLVMAHPAYMPAGKKSQRTEVDAHAVVEDPDAPTMAHGEAIAPPTWATIPATGLDNQFLQISAAGQALPVLTATE